MSGCLLLLGAIAWFALMYFVVGRGIERLFGIDASRKTPAFALRDGRDYEPAHPMVLFGHHFAGIAGAGPIVGPIIALKYGWAPALAWILLGCVFLGAFHDFAAMFISIRHEGKSIAGIVEKVIGRCGRQVFILFCIAALVLVVAVFSLLVAKTFTSTPATATASLLFIAMAPVFGWLTYRRGLPLLIGTCIFVPLVFLSIGIGMCFPLDLVALLGWSEPAVIKVWLAVLLLYAAVASVIPVWQMLQPRDYLNAYLLYAMVLVGLLGVFVCSPTIRLLPVPDEMSLGKGFVQAFPLLFVTIACGACSGFHALVASGTSAKQLSNERHICPVAYGAMLVEGVLAVIAVISVAYLAPETYRQAAGNPVRAFASGIASFAQHLGLPQETGATFISLAISAFIMTSLDTGARLTRFLWCELWQREGRIPPPSCVSVLTKPIPATVVVIAIVSVFCFTGAADKIWPVFGATNQLLAALTLMVATLVLRRAGRSYLWPLAGMTFMLLVSASALVTLLLEKWQARDYPLTITTLFLLATAVWLCLLAGKAFFNKEPEKA